VNFWQLLINCIFRIIRKEIPFTIDTKELLIRGIVHPMFYSNSDMTIKREAFLPPPNQKDVSLLRHSYTNDNFCKKRISKLKLGNNVYCGMATFHMFHINEIKNIIPINERIDVEVNGTPLDANDKYIDSPPVYTNMPGTPMHADLVYEFPIVKGQPQTKHRKYASLLAKISNYFNDPTPESSVWLGEKLKWVKK